MTESYDHAVELLERIAGRLDELLAVDIAGAVRQAVTEAMPYPSLILDALTPEPLWSPLPARFASPPRRR